MFKKKKKNSAVVPVSVKFKTKFFVASIERNVFRFIRARLFIIDIGCKKYVPINPPKINGGGYKNNILITGKTCFEQREICLKRKFIVRYSYCKHANKFQKKISSSPGVPL